MVDVLILRAAEEVTPRLPLRLLEQTEGLMGTDLWGPKKGAGNKKRNPWLLMALMAALVGSSMAQLFMVPSVASAQNKITPYVLDTEVYGFENDPHGALGIKTTFARRSDGASARVDNLRPIPLGITGRMVTFMDGRSVTVVDAFRTKTTWRPIPASTLRF